MPVYNRAMNRGAVVFRSISKIEGSRGTGLSFPVPLAETCPVTARPSWARCRNIRPNLSRYQFTAVREHSRTPIRDARSRTSRAVFDLAGPDGHWDRWCRRTRAATPACCRYRSLTSNYRQTKSRKRRDALITRIRPFFVSKESYKGAHHGIVNKPHPLPAWCLH